MQFISQLLTGLEGSNSTALLASTIASFILSRNKAEKSRVKKVTIFSMSDIFHIEIQAINIIF